MKNAEIQNITIGQFNRLKNWLSNTKGYDHVYIGKVLQSVKTILFWGIEHEYIDSDPLNHYRVKIPKNENGDYLEKEDIEKLESQNFDAWPEVERLNNVRDSMLLMIYTGLEYSGAKKLRFTEHIVVEQGRLCLCQSREKTKKRKVLSIRPKINTDY